MSVPKPGVCTGGAPNAPERGKGCGQYVMCNILNNFTVNMVLKEPPVLFSNELVTDQLDI